MAKNKIYTVKLRRKREGKTNYRKRLKYISSGKTRVVIRPSNNNIKIQAIDFSEGGDLVLNTVDSTDLRKLGWKHSTGNLSAAYLTGLLFGTKIKSKVSEAVVDVGLRTIRKDTKLSAVLSGLVDSGLKIPFSQEVIPSSKKLDGTLTSEYSKKLNDTNKDKHKIQFSKYLKSGIDPEKTNLSFEEIKKKLIEA